VLLSIPVNSFLDPAPRCREHNAILRAIDIAPSVQLIGKFESERWYRVQAEGRDRHCVIVWRSDAEDQEVASCDCPAFFIPVSGPTPCFHVGAVLIHEAVEK
jgi:hypothetical protein